MAFAAFEDEGVITGGQQAPVVFGEELQTNWELVFDKQPLVRKPDGESEEKSGCIKSSCDVSISLWICEDTDRIKLDCAFQSNDGSQTSYKASSELNREKLTQCKFNPHSSLSGIAKMIEAAVKGSSPELIRGEFISIIQNQTSDETVASSEIDATLTITEYGFEELVHTVVFNEIIPVNELDVLSEQCRIKDQRILELEQRNLELSERVRMLEYKLKLMNGDITTDKGDIPTKVTMVSDFKLCEEISDECTNDLSAEDTTLSAIRHTPDLSSHIHCGSSSLSSRFKRSQSCNPSLLSSGMDYLFGGVYLNVSASVDDVSDSGPRWKKDKRRKPIAVRKVHSKGTKMGRSISTSLCEISSDLCTAAGYEGLPMTNKLKSRVFDQPRSDHKRHRITEMGKCLTQIDESYSFWTGVKLISAPLSGVFKDRGIHQMQFKISKTIYCQMMFGALEATECARKGEFGNPLKGVGYAASNGGFYYPPNRYDRKFGDPSQSGDIITVRVRIVNDRNATVAFLRNGVEMGCEEKLQGRIDWSKGLRFAVITSYTGDQIEIVDEEGQ